MKLLGSRFCGLVAGVFFAAAPALAEGEKAGDFDYYVMSLSWSAGWCAEDAARKSEPQCALGRKISFVLHGLWPQYERGWPSYCRTVHRDPSRLDTARQEDLFGSSGAAFYQWKKHGRCAGLSAADYFATARQAFGSVNIPEVLQKLQQRVKLPATVVEAAFIEANPGLRPDQITVTCAKGRIDEVRICLDKEMQPRRCGIDVIRDCALKEAILEPPR